MAYLCLMLNRLLWATALLALPLASHAQQVPDYGQIIRDIIEGAPIAAPNAQVTTIPVTVSFDIAEPLTGYRLSLTALDANSEIVGQSVLRLTGLSAPITLPVHIAGGANAGVIVLRGSLDDPTRQRSWQSLNDTVYSGAPLQMRLSPTVTDTDNPQTIDGFKRVSGTVILKNPSTIFAGAVLTVELIEDGLAGGTGSPVKGSTQVTITDPTRPVPFDMSFGVPSGGFIGALGLKATVRDWAGRVTHVMPGRLSYTGTQQSYQLTLDSLRQGAEVAPFSVEMPDADQPVNGMQTFPSPTATTPTLPNITPPAMMPAPTVSATLISSATFPAFRGLPVGSTLNVILWTPQADGAKRVINRQAILLDGLSGDIDFAFPDAQVPQGAALYFDADITTRDSIRLFAAIAQPTGAGYSVLRLSPLPAY